MSGFGELFSVNWWGFSSGSSARSFSLSEKQMYNKLMIKMASIDQLDKPIGPVPRKMVTFNPGLSQILSKVFLSDNM